MSRQPRETIIFETEVELEAFMKGYRLGVKEQCDEIDCVSCFSNGVWRIELIKVYDEGS